MKTLFNKLPFILICLAAVLNLAAVRKKEDPILLTQTNPIAYKDKLEETKDGEKGPPSPTYKFYPRNKFLTEPPVETEPEESPVHEEGEIPEWGDPIPENLEGWEDESFEGKDSSKEQEMPKIEGESLVEGETAVPAELSQEEKEPAEEQTQEWWQEEEVPAEGGNAPTPENSQG